MFSRIFLCFTLINYVGHKKQQQNGYSTWDPRKAKNGEVPQYDEIPYGDVGPSGKGQLPQVPAEYSQVPGVPQRQGTISHGGAKITLYLDWKESNRLMYLSGKVTFCPWDGNLTFCPWD